MAQAIKVMTHEGKAAYLGLYSVAYMMQEEGHVRVCLTSGLELGVLGDMDDMAEMVWGGRKDMPQRPSRRNLPEGTVIEAPARGSA